MHNFKDLINSVEYPGEDAFFDKDMVEHEIRAGLTKNIVTTARDEYRSCVVDKTTVVAFIKSAYRKKDGRLLNSIME